MVIKMLLNCDIKKNCSNDFTLSKENKCNYVHLKKKIKLQSFHLDKISIRYNFQSLCFCYV